LIIIKIIIKIILCSNQWCFLCLAANHARKLFLPWIQFFSISNLQDLWDTHLKWP